MFFNGEEVCQTPYNTLVKRKISGSGFEMRLEGYQSQKHQLKKSFDEHSIMNLLMIPGWLIDWASRSLMKYDIARYQIQLEPKANSEKE